MVLAAGGVLPGPGHGWVSASLSLPAGGLVPGPRRRLSRTPRKEHDDEPALPKEGKNWARVTSTVFFGIDCLGVLVILAGILAVMHSVSPSLKTILLLSGLASIVVWAVGLATITLLWRRESSEYYAAMSPR